jgi:hypothetical protein
VVTLALSASYRAPGWVFLPAALVLAYSFLLMRHPEPSGLALVWQWIATVAGFLALATMVWWAASVVA